MTLFSEISTDAALAMPAMAVLMFFVGASIGSFLNVVVYRVPAGLSIVRPASRCPNCSTPIRSTDNVPVLGWLRLRGRCRACGQPISARYPLVELLAGLMFMGLAWLEWPAGGVNLPGMELSPLERYGIFAYHAVLLLGLLTVALMEYDGHAPVKLTILLGLAAVIAGAMWPMLHPVSPPLAIMREQRVIAPQAIGLVDGLAGWVVGIVMGCVAAMVTDRGPSGVNGRNLGVAVLAAVGAFLGWQAVATIGGASIAIYSLAIMFRAGWPRLAGLPFCGVVFALTLAWLLAWRPIVDRWPLLGSGADYRTLLIAGGMAIAGGVLVAIVVRRPVASA